MKILTRLFYFFVVAMFLLMATLLFNSCSAEKRLNRIIKNNPHLVEKEVITIIDTIRDTIYIEIPGAHIDTFVSIQQLKDTVYLNKDQLKVTVFQKGDTVYIEGNCDPIIKKIPYEKIIIRKVPVEKIIYRRPRDWLRISVFAFLLGFVAHYIIQLVQKRPKEPNT